VTEATKQGGNALRLGPSRSQNNPIIALLFDYRTLVD
jgi:hypothetical protein